MLRYSTNLASSHPNLASSSIIASSGVSVHTHPYSQKPTSSRATAKNIAVKSLKIALVTLKEVLDDLPVPGAVAINAVIKLIDVAEVGDILFSSRRASQLNLGYNNKESRIESSSPACDRSTLCTFDGACS